MKETAFLCLLFLLSAVAGNDKPSAYEALGSYHFPIGLLPEGISGYHLESATGEFSAFLNDTCTFKLSNNYELEYSPIIKGVISRDKLEKLEGVKVKVVLLWLSIMEVTRDGGELEFSVGVASKKFPITNFDECPQCGCGVDCSNTSHHSDEVPRKVKLVNSFAFLRLN